MADLTITNVRIFTGRGLGAPSIVFVEGGRLADRAAPGAEVVDGRGATLLPGLIDTHVHVDTLQQLKALGRWGVTTALDMGTADWPATSALRGMSGFTDLRSAGAVACAPNGVAVRKMGYPASSAVSGTDDAARFVGERAEQRVDYVKIVLEEAFPFRPKPLDAATVAALSASAHECGLLVCVHATSVKSVRAAMTAGVDVITHVPLVSSLDDALARAVALGGVAVSPTLVMMKKLVERFPAPIKPRSITYANAVESVRALHRAGAVILAGTDANDDPTAPNTIAHGAALHVELELLVAAGLSPVEAINAATRSAADVFGLADRGRIEPGLRADLLMVDGDPTVDIRATQNIRMAWAAGQLVR
jgi:imidazolonepropionase-like amidohydrolase